jgi:hypothetical protein
MGPEWFTSDFASYLVLEPPREGNPRVAHPTIPFFLDYTPVLLPIQHEYGTF